MARLAKWLRHAALVGVTAVIAATSATVVAGVYLPKLEKGKGEKCVEDTQYMRKNHMELLKHQRDDTMRRGIRTSKHSLKQCVECHASSKTGSVAASKEDFCMACHVYASVKLDCWECHATKPGKKKQSQLGLTPLKPAVSPLLASSLNEASK